MNPIKQLFFSIPCRRRFALLLCLVTMSVSANAQVVTGTEFTSSPNDTFTDPPNTMPHYGLTWADFSGGQIGSSAAVSGYGGINLYTNGTRRATITYAGNFGLATANPFATMTIQSSGYWGYLEGQPNALQILSGTSTGSDYTMYMGVDKTNHLSYIQSVLWGTTVASLAINARGGNVGIGTASPNATLEVNGNLRLTSGSGASITFADGTVQSTAYTGISCGGDFAESVDVTGKRGQYEPGDLLVIDPHRPGEFKEAAEPYSTLVAGIYSTKPGYVGRRLTGPKSPDEVPLAMVGIVPTKVTAENGPIHTGDLLEIGRAHV